MNDPRTQLDADRLPRHVAIILDGNGRWAQRRGLSRLEGHVAGAQAVERLIRFVVDHLELQYLTLFAFSAENWNRPASEVGGLMDLLRQFALDKLGDLQEGGVRLHLAGNLSRLPEPTRAAVAQAADATQRGTGLQLTIALDYGGQQEIVAACRRIAQEVASGELAVEDIDAETVASRLFTAGLPDPDLVIRTSGELRLSNFLLWQSAYAELAFTPTLWPDFTPDEFVAILAEYQTRHRRFGRVEGE